jgi:hypothetical protein
LSALAGAIRPAAASSVGRPLTIASADSSSLPAKIRSSAVTTLIEFACLAQTAAAQICIQRHIMNVGLDRADVAYGFQKLGGVAER